MNNDVLYEVIKYLDFPVRDRKVQEAQFSRINSRRMMRFNRNLVEKKLSDRPHIHSTSLRIQLTILKDRLYIQEGISKGFRVTSLNIEDRTAESIFLEDFMKISVCKGDKDRLGEE
ncbi:hypothetical protein P7C65_05s1g07040 [Encephalitozoon intestinalis]